MSQRDPGAPTGREPLGRPSGPEETLRDKSLTQGSVEAAHQFVREARKGYDYEAPVGVVVDSRYVSWATCMVGGIGIGDIPSTPWISVFAGEERPQDIAIGRLRDVVEFMCGSEVLFDGSRGHGTGSVVEEATHFFHGGGRGRLLFGKRWSRRGGGRYRQGAVARNGTRRTRCRGKGTGERSQGRYST